MIEKTVPPPVAQSDAEHPAQMTAAQGKRGVIGADAVSWPRPLGIALLVFLFRSLHSLQDLLAKGEKVILPGQGKQPEGIGPETQVFRRQVEPHGDLLHPLDPRDGLAAVLDGFGASFTEQTQQLPQRVTDEDGVPVHGQKRRDADSTEIQLTTGNLLDIEPFADHLFRQAQQFEESLRVTAFHLPGICLDRLLDRCSLPEDLQDDVGVDLIPETGRLKKGQPTKRQPATGLAPDADPDDITGRCQLGIKLPALPADEGRVLACPFIFAPGLQLDELFSPITEKLRVQRQIPEKIRFTMLHRQDEERAVYPLKRLAESPLMPDEITNGIGANRPGTQDHHAPVALENRQQDPQQPVELLRCPDQQLAAKIPIDIPAVAFTDPDNQSADLGKLAEHRLDLTDQQLLGSIPSPANPFPQGRSLRQDIHRQVNFEPMAGTNGEQKAIFLLQQRCPGVDGGFDPVILRQMGDIIEADGRIPDMADLGAEQIEVAGDSGKLLPALVRLAAEMGERDLRPVDPSFPVSLEKRPDRINKEDVHFLCGQKIAQQSDRCPIPCNSQSFLPISGQIQEYPANHTNRCRLARDENLIRIQSSAAERTGYTRGGSERDQPRTFIIFLTSQSLCSGSPPFRFD